MKKKLVNQKVVNSIGIGILAFITSASPVLAAGAGDVDVPDLPTDTLNEDDSDKDVPGDNEGQNAAVVEEISEAQAAIDQATKEITGIQEEEKREEPTETPVEPEVPEESETTPAEADGTDTLETGEPDTPEGTETPEEEPEETDVREEIKGSLTEAETDLETLKVEIQALDGKNQDAKEAKDKLEEIVTDDETGSLGLAAGNVAGAKDTAETTSQEIAGKVPEAEEKADVLEEAPTIVYENKEAAKQAQEQAKAEAAEIEAVYEEAKDAAEKAEEEVKTAEESLNFLEDQKEQADAAYEVAKEKVQAAQNALKALLKANGITEEELEEGELTGSGYQALKKAQAALEEAQADLDAATAEKAEADQAVETAKGELGDAQNALEGIQTELERLGSKKTTAETNLDQANATLERVRGELAQLQEEYDGLVAEQRGLEAAVTSKSEAKAAADQAAEDAAKALEDAQKALEKEQALETLFTQAKEQQEDSRSKYDSWKEINQTLSPGKAKNARDQFYLAADKVAKTLISYELQKTDKITSKDEVTFSEFVKDQDTNNYVEASYQDENGETQYEYYDYSIDENGKINIVKKTPIYQQEGSNLQLTVTTDADGNKVYHLGDQTLDADNVEGNARDGYTVKNIPATVQTWERNGKVLVGITKYGETIYYVNDKKVNVTFGPLGTPYVNLAPWAGAKANYPESTTVDIHCGNIKTFDGKGDPYLTEADFNDQRTKHSENVERLETGVTAATQAKGKADTAVVAAENELTDAITARDRNVARQTELAGEDGNGGALAAAQTSVSSAESQQKQDQASFAQAEASYNTQAQCQKAQEDAISRLETALTAARAAAEAAQTRGENADKVKGIVEAAYEKVRDAINNLSNLTAQQDVDEEAYQALVDQYDQAVADYKAAVAANGASRAALIQIQNAANRARAAAEAAFNYNIASNPEEGTNPGGGDNGSGSETNPGGGDNGSGSVTNPGGGVNGSGSETNPGGETTAPGGSGDTGISTGGFGTTGEGTGSTTSAPGRRRGSTGGGNAAEEETAAPAGDALAAGNVTADALTAVNAPVAAAPATAVPAVAADTADAGEGALQTVADEEVPLAEGIAPAEETGGKDLDTAEETIGVEDEEVPLSDFETEQKRMSWWWLLIILLLGVTGEEMYRRHRRKLAETDRTDR